jgi:hypothetical protein
VFFFYIGDIVDHRCLNFIFRIVKQTPSHNGHSEVQS